MLFQNLYKFSKKLTLCFKVSFLTQFSFINSLKKNLSTNTKVFNLLKYVCMLIYATNYLCCYAFGCLQCNPVQARWIAAQINTIIVSQGLLPN